MPSTISAPVTAPQVEPWCIPEPKWAPSLYASSSVKPHSLQKGTSTDWQQLKWISVLARRPLVSSILFMFLSQSFFS